MPSRARLAARASAMPDAISPPRLTGDDLAYIGVGSNLGDRLGNLSGATRALADGHVPGVRLVRVSPVFETRPLGPARYPFLNAVLEVAGRVDPEALLAALQRIEARHGRQRELRWGPRTLDLDLLTVLRDGLSLPWASPRLRLPHPELGRRDFVLAPLAALRPDLRPGGPETPTVRELLDALPVEDRTILERCGLALC